MCGAILQTVRMWGALTFLCLFLVIDPTTREAILTAVEEARVQLAVEAPWPYFLLVIVVGSALVSALIMKFWPKSQNKSRRIQIMHRYQGPAASDLMEIRRAPALGLHPIVELAGLILPVRARNSCGRLLRNFAGYVSRKRLLGA